MEKLIKEINRIFRNLPCLKDYIISGVNSFGYAQEFTLIREKDSHILTSKISVISQDNIGKNFYIHILQEVDEYHYVYSKLIDRPISIVGFICNFQKAVNGFYTRCPQILDPLFEDYLNSIIELDDLGDIL